MVDLVQSSGGNLKILNRIFELMIFLSCQVQAFVDCYYLIFAVCGLSPMELADIEYKLARILIIKKKKRKEKERREKGEQSIEAGC